MYVVNEMYGGDIGMQVIDLSPLPDSEPLQLSTYNQIAQSHNLWINETGYAFIEHQAGDNIHITNLSNPALPEFEKTMIKVALSKTMGKKNECLQSNGWNRKKRSGNKTID